MIMKKDFLKFGPAIIFILLYILMLTTCSDISDQLEIHNLAKNGYGKIAINFSMIEIQETVRTILPSKNFDKYSYYFTKVGSIIEIEVEPDDDGFFTLEIGDYTVVVHAYMGDEEPFNLAAIGQSVLFSVGTGFNTPVSVTLSEVTSEDEGKFFYTINYPENADAKITLQKWPSLENITLTPVSQENSITQLFQLDNGTYILTVLINKDHLFAGISEAVHIYPYLTTVYTKEFSDDDLLLAQYTVTFDANEATSGTAPIAQTISGGSSITLPEQGLLTKTNHTFKGWNTKADSSGTTYESATSYTVTENITLYAHWEIPKFTVSFDLNGGSGITPPAITNIIIGSTLNIEQRPISADFTREYFLNDDKWYIDDKCTTEFIFGTTPVTSDITLYLNWIDQRPMLTGTVNINGTLQTGQTLTAVTTNLEGSGTISYQWMRGITPVGTNNSNYTVVADDVGTIFTLIVTRAENSSSVTSLPMLTGILGVNGTLQTGQTLTANTFSLGGSGDITTYEWMRGSTVVSNDSTYIVEAADVGNTNFTLRIIRANNSGFIASNPMLTGTINIDGTLQTSQMLIAEITSLGGSGTITYQWMRGSTTVGSNNNTYNVVTADTSSTNFTLRVIRTDNSGYIDSNPMLTGTVSISGITEQGHTLTANTGSLGGDGIISYQWRRGTTNIGTNNNTYVLQSADIGSRITVTVTRSFNSGRINSTQTAIIKPNLRLPYYYPGTDKTYNGFSGTEGNWSNFITGGVLTITYPIETTFNADAFFTLEGSVNDSSVSNYALIRVIKNSDTSLITNYFVQGNYKQRIWLRFGSGAYTVTIHELANININSQGLIQSWSYWSASRTFNVTNTQNEGDMRFRYPSYIVQSDDLMITNLAAELTHGITDNTEKIRAIHDYIVKNTVYDMASVDGVRKRQDALSVLSTRYYVDSRYNNGHFFAVCEGFSNAFAAIARAAGFDVRYIVSDPMNHAWNHVYISGAWRFIDVTWASPVPDQGPDYTRYTYFLLTNLNGVSNSHTGWEINTGRSLIPVPIAPWQRDVPQGWY